MVKVGIDFSLNSPAMCVEKDGQLEFVSFFNTDGSIWDKTPVKKKFYYHNEIKHILTLIPYCRTKLSKNTLYKDEQRSKLADAIMVAELITNMVKVCSYGNGVEIALEGFAYQSTGQAFIDLIMFNTILRHKLINEFGEKALTIVAPTEAKKLAGKGNGNKEYMINAFKENKLHDPTLPSNSLYQYVNTHKLDYNNIKPIDDLIDSYWLLKTLK